MKKLILSLAMVAGMTTACTQQKAAENTNRQLVLYYSENGSTKAVAEELQKQLGADIEAIEVVEPYSGDFQATIERSNKERESGQTPALKALKSNLADYDTIFLGYPIWFGTYAMPIATLVKEQDFEGKTIIPFCTFGSGGLNTSTADLEKAFPKAHILKGYGVRAARVTKAAKELDRFLIENGYKEGTVEKLPEYSAQQPVTDEDKAIFDAACSDYQFPLGTPETVGKRETSESVDYQFTVKGKGMNGEETTSTIFVTVGKEEGAKPEFTEVVR